MKKIALAGVLSFLLFLPHSAQADLSDYLQYFADPNWGEDPEGPDTVYITCGASTPSKVVLQVRMKTDNLYGDTSFNTGNLVIALYIPLIIYVDQEGVVLDTTISTTYAGTSLEDWGLLALTVTGSPEQFPLKVLVGGRDDYSYSHQLIAGDHLLANLTFAVSRPTNICIDTSSNQGVLLPLLATTSVAIDYQPQWRSACCGPVVPTLSQYGLLIFGVLLFGMMVYAIKKAKRVLT